MSDEVAIAVLAAFGAVATTFRFVGSRLLNEILDVSERPRWAGELDDYELEHRRARLARLRPAATAIIVVVGTIALTLVSAAGAAIASMMEAGRATWPLMSLAAVAAVWVPTSWFITRRCGLLIGDLSSVEAEQAGRAAPPER